MVRYAYVWEYEVREDRRAEFERVYGADGDWARLFRRDPAYLGTDLLRDRDDPRRYWTVDRWASRAACTDFRERNRAEFDEIDRRAEELTLVERRLGEFDLADRAAQRAPAGSSSPAGTGKPRSRISASILASRPRKAR